MKRLARIDFCGTFGDPCVARDFYEICELLVKKYGITIMVSTNGSMRNPAWWKKLGKLFAGTRSWLEFHVDGLRNTNHLYRIGANWENIMANANAFISGGARASGAVSFLNTTNIKWVRHIYLPVRWDSTNLFQQRPVVFQKREHSDTCTRMADRAISKEQRSHSRME